MSRRQELLFCSAYRKQISAVSRRNRGWATWNAPATRKRRILPTRNCSRFARSRLIRWWSTKSLYGPLWHNPRASTSIGELVVQAGLSISVDFMALMELSPLILRVATVFLRRPARCNLIDANLEGHFRNAYAVWTT